MEDGAERWRRNSSGREVQETEKKKKKKKKEIKEEALEHRHNAASDCLSCCSISSDQSIFA